jgi:DNA-binding Lrp family transcriptional regulator
MIVPAKCGGSYHGQPNSGGNAETFRPEHSACYVGGFFILENGGTTMNIKLLKLLSKNARYSVQDLAVMTGMDEEAVKQEMAQMEKDGLIRGYKAVVDWERMDSSTVSAIIELKVTPKAGLGFEEVAQRVMKYPEVESVYLMSGGYDLSVVVKGKTFQEVALFVAKELSTIDSVLSTSTHFVLRRYKELDVELFGEDGDDRGNFSL